MKIINRRLFKTLFLTLSLSLFTVSLFCQEIPENSEENTAENNNSGEKDDDDGIYNYINSELQKNFTIVISDHNFDLNPQTSAYSVEAQILTGLYEGLFSYDPITLNPKYAIAKEYRISRDKKRWTFLLREDAFFSDGSKITAEKVRNSWIKLLKNPYAPFSSLFDIVTGAEDFRKGLCDESKVGIYAVDENTISIHLKNPQSHLPKLLCMSAFAIVSEKENVYSGPFVLSSYENNEIILEKNKNYWDKEKTPLEKITFLISSNQTENAYFFNTGLADWVSSSIDAKKIISKDCSHLTAEFATEYLFFKNRTLSDGKESIWNNANLRAALLEAVPWDKLREDTFVKASSLVYPLAGYPQVQGYVYTDKVEALSLIKEARKNLNIKDDEILPLKFAISESDHMKKQAEILKEAWAALGVEVIPVEVSFNEYLAKINVLDADLFSYTWIGDFADPVAFLELFRKNSTLNVSGWANDEYDRLIDEASLYTDENHVKLLAKAEQLLLDNAEILPIQHPVSFNVIDLNAVGGWASNSFDIHPLKYLFKRETKPNVPNIVIIDEKKNFFCKY